MPQASIVGARSVGSIDPVPTRCQAEPGTRVVRIPENRVSGNESDFPFVANHGRRINFPSSRQTFANGLAEREGFES
jgi:hypothetical protein